MGHPRDKTLFLSKVHVRHASVTDTWDWLLVFLTAILLLLCAPRDVNLNVLVVAGRAEVTKHKVSDQVFIDAIHRNKNLLSTVKKKKKIFFNPKKKKKKKKKKKS